MAARRTAGYSKLHLNRGSPELEERITARIIALTKTQSGTARLQIMKQLQLEFFLVASRRVHRGEGREKTYSDYLDLVDRLMGHTDFVCNINEFKNLDISRGFVVVNNHFGIAKATKITSAELIERLATEVRDQDWLGEVATLPNDEPFPLRRAGIFKALFSALGKDKIAPHEMQMSYPYPFDEIQKDCGAAIVRLDRPGGYAAIKRQFDEFFLKALTSRKIPIAILSAEIGTTGKRDPNGSPYELGVFKTGFAVYAAEARVPIIPVIQVVGENADFFTQFLSPLEPPKGLDRSLLTRFAAEVRTRMQHRIWVLLHEIRK